MKILVINSGSSSIKYRLFDMGAGTELAAGIVERIGEAGSRHIHRSSGRETEYGDIADIPTHRQGIARIESVLTEAGDVEGLAELSGIGHRVVHGGSVFRAPVIVDAKVVAAIRELVPLAPLHNPANLVGIEAALSAVPQIPQVAVFDTAFHHDMAPAAYTYAIPHAVAAGHGIRRYGFHGTSHAFVAQTAADHLCTPLAQLNLITLHLGNGASATAIKNGRCMDTSMGMTPLEGLIMGTRCGDLDPGALLYLIQETGGDAAAMDTLLNRDSGLKGICGENDMRVVLRNAGAGDARARLAVGMVVHRLKKYIGAYHAIIGGARAVVFTGGIGENAPEIRRRVCRGLEHIGIRIDAAANMARPEGVLPIHAPDSPVSILVVPTNEELAIARETVACLGAGG